MPGNLAAVFKECVVLHLSVHDRWVGVYEVEGLDCHRLMVSDRAAYRSSDLRTEGPRTRRTEDQLRTGGLLERQNRRSEALLSCSPPIGRLATTTHLTRCFRCRPPRRDKIGRASCTEKGGSL